MSVHGLRRTAPVAGLALVAALAPLTSFDLFWHLAAGREILQRRAIPRHDPFSFASDAERWLDHGWLFQTLTALLEGTGGPWLLVAFQVVLVLVIALTAARQLAADGMAAAPAAFAVALALAVARPRLALRPELVTLALLAVALWRVRALERPAALGSASLAALMLLWINMHPGALLGAAILVFAIAFAWIASRMAPGSFPLRPAREWLLALGAVLLPLLANPYGVAGVLFPFRLEAQVTGGTFVNPEWLPPTPARLPLLFAALAAGAALLLVEVLRRRQEERAPQLPPAGARAAWFRWALRAAVFAGFALLALRYQRNVGVLGVAWPFLCGPALAGFAELARGRGAAIAAFGALALAATTAPGVRLLARGAVDRSVIPVDAVDAVERLGVRGHVFNRAAFGGYLIFRLFPRQQVLIDGRNEVYTKLLPQLVAALGDSRRWNRFLEEQRIEWALLGYGEPPQRVQFAGGGSEVRPFAYNHFPPNDWALLYWDDTAMLLVRRGGANAALTDGAPRFLWPESPEFLGDRVASGAWPRAAVAAELAAAARRLPGSERVAALATALAEAP